MLIAKDIIFVLIPTNLLLFLRMYKSYMNVIITLPDECIGPVYECYISPICIVWSSIKGYISNEQISL